MKNYLLILITICSIAIFSCTKKDDTVSPTAVNPTTVSNNATAGSWRVTYYWDTDHDETSSFSGYSFTFGASNNVTAVKSGASSVTGTWSTGTDNSTTKFILSFASPASFLEISDDWHVIEMTATKIALKDVSGGNGGIDYLTFEKN